MSNPFAKLTATDQMEAAQDRLGGFTPLPSDVYEATIKVAYAGSAANSNAQSVTLHADIGGKEYRETFWVTSKEGDNFYYDKNDKKKKIPLAGFIHIDDICLLTTGMPLSEQAIEEKTVKIWNGKEKREENRPMPVLVDLIDKKVTLGILRNIVDRQAKGQDGEYRNTGETRMENAIDKVFHHETLRTVNEYRNEVNTAEFMEAWVEKNKGQDRNRAKGVAGNAGGGAGAPGASGSGSPAKKLFGA